jgi:hypothetical protein
MAASLSILISDPSGSLTFQIFALTVVSGQACKNLDEITLCLCSWLQCVSRLRSFRCHQVRSKRERHLPFAARFAGNIGLRSNSPLTSSWRNNNSPATGRASNSGNSRIPQGHSSAIKRQVPKMAALISLGHNFDRHKGRCDYSRNREAKLEGEFRMLY